LQVPESLFDFEKENEDLVVLLKRVAVKHRAERPVDRVLDGKTVDQITQFRLVFLILIKLMIENG
jgi:hypothetical protein